MKKSQLLKTTSNLVLAIAACGTLVACASTSSSPEMKTTAEKVDAAIERAAEAQGIRIPPLGSAERQYNKDPKNPEHALKYAAALREANFASRASAVLAPFADDPKSIPGIKSEFAAIQLAQGNNESAERYAQKAVLQDPQDAKAFHYLGIALDAQGKHPEAERAFRKGLDLWDGDPTSIMNNLALNLSAQGFLDEAAEILERAKEISPNRIEIERNPRIVTALRQSGEPTTPKPKRKPAESDVETVEPSADETPPPAIPVKEVTSAPAN